MWSPNKTQQTKQYLVCNYLFFSENPANLESSGSFEMINSEINNEINNEQPSENGFGGAGKKNIISITSLSLLIRTQPTLFFYFLHPFVKAKFA